MLPDTVAVPTPAGALLHVESLGPYTSKVRVPVGDRPPASTALSVNDPPAWADPEGVVELIVGLAFVAVNCSFVSPHAVDTELLLLSPM